MMRVDFRSLGIAAVLVCGAFHAATGQDIRSDMLDKWVVATGQAAGAGEAAKEQAVAKALRTAVEQACGVFLTSQSKTTDYKAVYDKIIANAVGYVREYKVLEVLQQDGVTMARVRARVSTRKFEEDWAAIAHTVEQENNPRVVVAIVERTRQTNTGWTEELAEAGVVQSKIEDFFLSKGITLMDRKAAEKTSKRDVLLAVLKDDTQQIAAMGGRFDADVVVTGRASAKFGKTLEVGGVRMYQYTATLTVRVVQVDSARILAVKTYGPATYNSLQRGGGEDKALAKLAEESAPKLLAAVIEAWRKRSAVSRTVQLSISDMDYELWKTFKAEAGKLQGVQAVRLREITESVANIDVEYQFTNENLADKLSEMQTVKLKVEEITANRIRLKVSN